MGNYVKTGTQPGVEGLKLGFGNDVPKVGNCKMFGCPISKADLNMFICIPHKNVSTYREKARYPLD